jgi:hypothetical protein
MALDQALLREAKQARDRLLGLQHEAELAQVSYQHTIRRLHGAGGSLREIADALGLSLRLPRFSGGWAICCPSRRHGW